jgi:hypothetical protein
MDNENLLPRHIQARRQSTVPQACLGDRKAAFRYASSFDACLADLSFAKKLQAFTEQDQNACVK